jgi:hypothetical protein
LKRLFPLLISAILVVGILSSSAFLFVPRASAQTISPPSLDGWVQGACGHCSSLTITLTTVSAPDVIVVYQGDAVCGINLPTDTAGLTYTLRTYATYCPNAAAEESYAIAQAPLTGDTITCTATTNNWIYCLAFAVSGADISSPFDLAQPVVTSTGGGYQNGADCPAGPGGIYPCILSMTTSKPNDFVFTMGTDTAYGFPAETAGPGFTLMGAINDPIDGYVQYEVASSPLTNQVLPFGLSSGHGFLILGDAIQGTSSGTTSTTSTTSTSSSSSISMVTSTCVVTWTLSNGSPTAWSGNC